MYALRNKETGEYWLGQNSKQPRLYRKEGHAKGAISNSVFQSNYGCQTFLGLNTHELNELCKEGVTPTRQEIEIAQSEYRLVQAKHPDDTNLVRAARDKYVEMQRSAYKQADDNRKRLIQERCKYEVVVYEEE